MILAHKLLPLFALLLNLLLLWSTLAPDRRSPRDKIFACLTTALALWNFGVLGLRWTDDTDTALVWERILHIGVILIPVLFYHYVLVFLSASVRRPSVVLGYGLCATFIALSPTPLFMADVTTSAWGFMPVSGRLYTPFLVYFQMYLVVGLIWLIRAYRSAASSFTRNRMLLVIFGVAVSLLGGAVDFVRFKLGLGWLYPMGIPTNTIFGVALGVAIVRYQLVDIGALAKRFILYFLTWIALAPVILFLGIYMVNQLTPGHRMGLSLRNILLLLLPLTVAFPLLPVLRKLEAQIERIMFRRQYGVRDALITLTKDMASVLDIQTLGDALTNGLVRRIPLTHASLYRSDPSQEALVPWSRSFFDDVGSETPDLELDPRLVSMLETTRKTLVVEETAFAAPGDARIHAAIAELGARRVALLVPLFLANQLAAVLVAGEKLSGEIFELGEIELLEALGGHTAIALRNSRLFEETERRRRAAESLAQVGRLVSQSLDPEEVGQRIVDSLRTLLGTHSAALYRIDPTSGALTVLAISGDVGPTFGRNVVFPRGTGVVGLVVRERGPIMTPNLLTDPRITLTDDLRGQIKRSPHRAVLSVPLVVSEQVIGALSVGDRSGRAFQEEESRLAQAFADQAAVALENARLYAQGDRERRRLETLYDVTRRMAAVHDPDQVLSLIVHEAARLLDAEAAGIRQLEGDELVVRAATELGTALTNRPRLRLNESLSGAVVMTGAPVVVEDIVEDTRYDAVQKQAALDHGCHGALSVPLRAHGKIIGVLNVLTKNRRRFMPDDISLLSAFADQASLVIDQDRLAKERQRAEEVLRQSEKLASMGQLLAGVAHELNNPLTVIIGHTTLLQRSLDGGPVAARAEQIVEAAERCARIVRNFLGLARQHPPARQRVDLNRLAQDAVSFLAYALEIDSVEVTLDLAADLPTLWADPHQLYQVVINLLSNAHQAVRAASDRRVILSTRVERERSRVFLEVADTGPGIPLEIRPRIFEPFFTTKPVGEGTGLGLSLCHGVVEGHGGTIRVESELGKGTAFIVELPVEVPPGLDGEAGALAAPSGVQGKAILVVDDEPVIADMLAEVLSHDGYDVETAGNGVLALEKLGQRHYDLVLSDIKMPGLDGPALYRELARRHPALLRRFVFVTGDTLSPATREFLEKTAAPWLSKPLNLNEMRRIVERTLERT